jgi:hypothetical protein
MGRELSARKAARQPVAVLPVKAARKPVAIRKAAPVEPVIVTGEPVIRAGVCPRCGRSDFRTENGRAWHVANAPDCTRYVNPGKHEYRTVAA